MTDFLRAVRLVLKSRATLVGVLISSLAVGVLWGANIGVAYPFIEVVFAGQSLHKSIDNKIEKAQKDCEELRFRIQKLQRQQEEATGELQEELSAELNVRQVALHAGQVALDQWLWVQPYIKRFLPDDAFQTLVLIVLAAVLGTILKDVCLVLNTILVKRLIQLAVLHLRMQFFRQTLRLDLAAFGERNTSELLSRFTFDISRLSGGLESLFGSALREPLKMIVCLAGACLISWRLLVLSLLVSPPALYLMRRLAGSIKRANRRAMEEMSQLYNALTETFSGIQAVKAFTMEPFERNRFCQSATEFYRKAMRIAFYSSLTKPITEMMGVGVISLALVAGAYLVLNQETHLLGIKMSERPLSVPMLLLFYGFLAGVSDPARKMAVIVAQVQSGVAAAERIYAMMDREPAILEPDNPKQIATPHQRLTFSDVSFGYHPDRPVLRNVTLELKFGETIAVVGSNGCGKSTLINLALRFYDPDHGSVQLDGVDLQEIGIRDLRGRIGLVTQQTFLFDDTVLSNIRYGTMSASDDEVMAAAKMAHAHRFIVDKLPDGYQSLVGQGGGRLSGGQRQRIALARAILRDPEILILDEATSQIDIESEQLIHSALKRFVRGRTAIMITHRLSTLALADRVLVMEAGRIVDVGPHEDLIERCSLYQSLHDAQFKQSA